MFPKEHRITSSLTNSHFVLFRVPHAREHLRHLSVSQARPCMNKLARLVKTFNDTRTLAVAITPNASEGLSGSIFKRKPTQFVLNNAITPAIAKWGPNLHKTYLLSVCVLLCRYKTEFRFVELWRCSQQPRFRPSAHSLIDPASFFQLVRTPGLGTSFRPEVS